ncbi:ATP-dependent DNA helicase [Tsukamurella sp. 8F]|uniref:ATP-dependent helicase n=1 Tax=unclassified Tsukamurella TaxID=2633480 RepID=UPI0023B91C10|nr:MULTISPECIES: ATP-dependent DNA helicase [unclassified Tsukamurella]MDF0528897.1 ATP-dependent DNA helicase [Tsukamurella sp. 8J]MDF0586732.1 ATP-dependent DNA helicase [Tsukamurella sp. 8F]
MERMGDGADAARHRRPQVTLAYRRPDAPPAREWGGAIAGLMKPSSGALPLDTGGWAPYRIRGGPGTGKTSALVDTAVAKLTDPLVDAESVLLLAGSRLAAQRLRREISARVLAAAPDGGRAHAAHEPLVRTVHSLAFAVLRLAATRSGGPPPRLITGSEQDAVIRELLRGNVEDGAAWWPTRLRPALSTNGFAGALRDLFAQVAQRGVGPEQLADLGREHGRDEWVAAARAYAEYQETTLLRGSVGLAGPQAVAPAVDAAELIDAAVTALATDDGLLSQQREKIRFLLVDDAQNLDPLAAALVRLLGTGTELTVIAGDPDQAVFSFRGAATRFLQGMDVPPDRDILLDRSFRFGDEIAGTVDRVSSRLPQRFVSTTAECPRPGTADVRIFATPAKEADAIAAMLRREHIARGVAWEDMAVVVRSVSASVAPLRRALAYAGVPVTVPSDDVPLARQRVVHSLLLVLRIVGDPASVEAADALTLLTGPVGDGDPLTFRRVRRAIRRVDPADERGSAQLLRDVLCGDIDAAPYRAALTELEAEPIERVAEVVEAARASAATGSVEDALWSAWAATGLAARWSGLALRGGSLGEQADRDLDAVLGLFDAAADFTDTLPTASVSRFVEYIEQLQIPRGRSRGSGGATAGVTLLSVHGAVGREWDVVAVAGIQEGRWPDLRLRGGLLGTQDVVDVIDGLPTASLATVSRSLPLLAEERRLLLVACSRARTRLLLTAVDSADGDGEQVPSRFLQGLAPTLTDDPETYTPAVETEPVAALDLRTMVATLRAVACSGTAEEAERNHAARQLARLAEAGVPGAHPSTWYGFPGTSTDDPLWRPDDGPVVLSPSNVEALEACALRWMLQRFGGRDGNTAQQITGNLVHTLAQAVAGRIPKEEVTAALRKVWERVDLDADWFARRELTRTESMLENLRAWLAATRTDLTEVAVEVGVDAVIPAGAGEEPDLRVRGRIDRLERDALGRPVPIDLKTGRTVPTKADAEAHAQLRTYQAALAHGGVPGALVEPGAQPGGGRLVYVAKEAKTGAAERVQPALTPTDVDEWLVVMRRAARATRGPSFAATLGPVCAHCDAASCCPAVDKGRAVTDD